MSESDPLEALVSKGTHFMQEGQIPCPCECNVEEAVFEMFYNKEKGLITIQCACLRIIAVIDLKGLTITLDEEGVIDISSKQKEPQKPYVTLEQAISTLWESRNIDVEEIKVTGLNKHRVKWEIIGNESEKKSVMQRKEDGSNLSYKDRLMLWRNDLKIGDPVVLATNHLAEIIHMDELGNITVRFDCDGSEIAYDLKDIYPPKKEG